METETHGNILRSRLKIPLFAFLGLAFLLLSLFVVFSYAVPGALGNAVRRVSPFPAIIVNQTSFLSFSEVARNVASIRRFYETQDLSPYGIRIDFSTEDGMKRLKIREKELLNKMIEDAAAESLARARGIVVTDEMTEESVRRKLDEYGSRDRVTEDMKRLYGWSLADFQKTIVKPALYQEELAKVFEKESPVTSRARERIREAADALSSGRSFSSVATEYSEGKTSSDGGSLGWFVSEDLAPELQNSVENAKKGVPTDILESSLGFHIVLVEDIREENGEKSYHLRQIFTRKPVYADFLSEEMKKMKIWVLDTEYNWNFETARIEFRDPTMRAFEKDLLKENPGEAAFFL